MQTIEKQTETNVVASVPRLSPYRTLDAWRGFASLWVAMYHMALVIVDRYPHVRSNPIYAFSLFGNIGVQLFFVISGYCIINAATSSLRYEDRFTRFMRARIRRIYPTYWYAFLLTAAMALVAAFLQARGTIGASTMADRDLLHQGPTYFVSNLTLTQLVFRQPLLVVQSWTLCYEIAFYLIVGLSLLVAMRLCSERRVLHSMHLLTALVMAALIVAPRSIPYPLDLWPQFGLGILVYDWIKHPRSPVPKVWMTAIGSLFLVFAALHNEPIGALGGPCRIPFLVCLAFACLLVFLYPHDGNLGRLRPVKFLSAVGLFSYSLYLTHTASIGIVNQIVKIFRLPESLHFVSFAVVIVSAVVFARIFYHFCERPFVRPKVRPAPDSQPAQAVTAP